VSRGFPPLLSGTAAPSATAARAVPYFLVEIHGNASRAMGLLVLVGIQNIPVPQALAERVIARVSADRPEVARDRVVAALRGEAYQVESARPA